MLDPNFFKIYCLVSKQYIYINAYPIVNLYSKRERDCTKDEHYKLQQNITQVKCICCIPCVRNLLKNILIIQCNHKYSKNIPMVLTSSPFHLQQSPSDIPACFVRHWESNYWLDLYNIPITLTLRKNNSKWTEITFPTNQRNSLRKTIVRDDAMHSTFSQTVYNKRNPNQKECNHLPTKPALEDDCNRFLKWRRFATKSRVTSNVENSNVENRNPWQVPKDGWNWHLSWKRVCTN